MQPQFDPTEEQALVGRYGPTRRREVEFTLDDVGFRYWLNATVIRQRRAEVVLIVQRPDGRLLLHTKTHHPPGTYRLPTGGVQWDEPVLEALAREQGEELGQHLALAGMAGIVHYTFSFGERAIPFASYLFVLRAGEDLSPQVQDPSEAISGFRWVAPGDIPAVAQQLRGVSHPWRGWGRFRAIPHELLAELWADGPAA